MITKAFMGKDNIHPGLSKEFDLSLIYDVVTGVSRT